MPKITDLTSFQGTLSDSDVFPVVNASVTKKIPLSSLRSNVFSGGSIPGSALADLGVTTAKLADLGITTAKLADLGITTAKLANQSVTTAKLADLEVTTAKLANQSVTTAKVNFNVSTLAFANPITWDLAANQVTKVILTANTTIANPTNKQEGAVYILAVIQDGTGSRTASFGADYKFPGNQAPSLTTYPNSVDIFTFLCIGAFLYGTYVYQYQ
jgi:hypothetical protein